MPLRLDGGPKVRKRSHAAAVAHAKTQRYCPKCGMRVWGNAYSMHARVCEGDGRAPELFELESKKLR